MPPLCSSPMLHLPSQSSMRFLHEALFFSLDNCSHCRRIVLRTHKSLLHYLRCSTCIPLCIVFCFYRAVGVFCSGLLVSRTLLIRVPCASCSPLHDFFLVLSPYDQIVLLTNTCLLLPSLFVPPLYHLVFPSPCEGLRISSPRIYIIHPPLRRFIVKPTQSPHRSYIAHAFFSLTRLPTFISPHTV